MSSLRNSKLGADLNVLDKLVTSILERHERAKKTTSPKLQRLKSSMSRSRNSSTRRTPLTSNEHVNGAACSQQSAMPTILEKNNNSQSRATTSWSELTNNVPGVRQIINTIANAPQRFSHGEHNDEENTNLTNNMLD